MNFDVHDGTKLFVSESGGWDAYTRLMVDEDRTRVTIYVSETYVEITSSILGGRLPGELGKKNGLTEWLEVGA